MRVVGRRQVLPCQSSAAVSTSVLPTRSTMTARTTSTLRGSGRDGRATTTIVRGSVCEGGLGCRSWCPNAGGRRGEGGGTAGTAVWQSGSCLIALSSTNRNEGSPVEHTRHRRVQSSERRREGASEGRGQTVKEGWPLGGCLALSPWPPSLPPRPTRRLADGSQAVARPVRTDTTPTKGATEIRNRHRQDISHTYHAIEIARPRHTRDAIPSLFASPSALAFSSLAADDNLPC